MSQVTDEHTQLSGSVFIKDGKEGEASRSSQTPLELIFEALFKTKWVNCFCHSEHHLRLKINFEVGGGVLSR